MMGRLQVPLSSTTTDYGPILEDPLKIHGVPHQEQVPLASGVLEQLKRVPLRGLNHLPAPGFASGRILIAASLGMKMDRGSKGYSVLTKRKPMLPIVLVRPSDEWSQTRTADRRNLSGPGCHVPPRATRKSPQLGTTGSVLEPNLT